MISPHNATHEHRASQPSIRVFSPLPEGHPCYALIGLIASEYARSENALDNIIFALGTVSSDVGSCITGQFVGMYPRYLALTQLSAVRHMPDDVIKEIRRQSEFSAKISEIRNRAIHDAWMSDKDTGETQQFRTKAKKIAHYGPQPVSIESLEEGLAQVRLHLERIYSLSRRISALLR